MADILLEALMTFLEENKTGEELRRSLRRSFAIRDGQVLGNFSPAEKEAIYQIAAELQAARQPAVPGRKRVAAEISVD